MRLVLNKIASENIADLFPSNWQPRPIMSTDDEKQYKVITAGDSHVPTLWVPTRREHY